MNYFGSAPQWLARLRAEAQDAANAEDYAALWRLRDDLRRDRDFWVQAWGPVLAIAARRLGRDDARGLLLEAIDAGFSPPENLEAELTRAFGGDADWEQLRERMRANVPPPPMTLRTWPRRTCVPDVGWYRLDPDAEQRLRQRLPAPRVSAWDTAVELLRWTAQRWRHANDHVDKPDALDILDKVESGHRFACVEYAIVLAQALNAVSIPARRLHMLTADYHFGLGRGHLTVAAWIDDLRSWVLLDPQNGMYWTDDDDVPASPLDLQRRFLAGRPRPRHVCVSTTVVDDAAAQGWWQHCRHLTIQGETSIAWDEEYVPVFQDRFTRNVDLLVTDAKLAFPDLSELSTSAAGDDGDPVLRFTPAHPYATGVTVTDGTGSRDLGLAENWPLRDPVSGEHHVEVAARTGYGTLSPQALEFTMHDRA